MTDASMIRGGEAGTTGQLKSDLKSGGAEWIKYLEAEEKVVRFLQEPHKWFKYYEHYIKGTGFFPCIGEDNDCEGCLQGDDPGRCWLAQVIWWDDDVPRVVPMKLKPGITGELVEFFERRSTLLDRDFGLWKEGSGQFGTSYKYDAYDREKMDLDEYQDQVRPGAEILLEALERAMEEPDEPEDEDEDDEEEPPRRTRSKAKAEPKTKPKRRSRTPEPDEDEDEDEDDDEEPPRRSRKSSKTSSRRRKPEPEVEDLDEDEDEEPEAEPGERPRRTRRTMRKPRDEEPEEPEDEEPESEDPEDDYEDDDDTVEVDLEGLDELADSTNGRDKVVKIAKDLGLKFKKQTRTATLVQMIRAAAEEDAEQG